MSEILRLDAISRNYHQGHETLHVLQNVSFALKQGEMAAMVGQSGSGKSTLLQIAGLLDRPTSGDVHILGHSCGKLSDEKRTRIRLKAMGFVYQYHHLLPDFSALENVMIPQLIAGKPDAQARIMALEMLAELGLEARIKHRPAELSGGEQQRVAIARALANQPKLILADEPTGNLDPQTAQTVFQLFLKLARSKGLTLLIATHNMELAAQIGRTLKLEKGKVI